MDPSLLIRSATSADASRIAENNAAMALETESKQLDPQVVLSGVQSLLDSPDSGFYLVAELDDKVVGCLMVTYEWSDWRDRQFWWIQSVYVDPSHRRQGVFRRLYDEVSAMARRRTGVCGIRLYVERDNDIAQSTYHRMGMMETPYRLFEQEL